MSTQTSHLEELQFLLAKDQFQRLSNQDITKAIFLSIEHLKNYPASEGGLSLVRRALSVSLDQTAIRLTLATQEGFVSEYFQMWHEFDTQKEAFDHVNKHHEKVFGRKKYANFKVFSKAIKNLPYKYNTVTMNLERN